MVKKFFTLALTAQSVKSHTVKNCITNLNILANIVPVKLYYIQAHVGNFGNEDAAHCKQTKIFFLLISNNIK